MDTIIITKIVSSTTTNDSGNKLKDELKTYFDAKTPVIVSFNEVVAISSSFFNSSFGSLIEMYGIEIFKDVVKPANIQRSVLERMQQWIKLRTI